MSMCSGRCRLCLCGGATGHLFAPRAELVARVRACCRLQIHRDDGLTEWICYKCIILLDQLTTFINICKESDRILRQNINMNLHEHKTEAKKIKTTRKKISDFNTDTTLIKTEVKSNDSDATNDAFEFDFGFDDKFEEQIVKVETDVSKVECVEARSAEIKINKPPKLKLCPLCGKVLHSTSFNLHMKRHGGEKTFACEKCDKLFVSNCMRNQHQLTHSTVKSFPCEQCGKLFSSLKLSKKHVRDVHLKLRRVQCNICQKYLSTKTSYENHMKTHTGQKDYECNICRKKFIHKLSIITHMRLHTGERPYGCQYCPSKFTHSKTLIEHERLHTGEAPHKCPVCGKGFAQQGNMKSHVKYNHKDVDMKK